MERTQLLLALPQLAVGREGLTAAYMGQLVALEEEEGTVLLTEEHLLK